MLLVDGYNCYRLLATRVMCEGLCVHGYKSKDDKGYVFCVGVLFYKL